MKKIALALVAMLGCAYAANAQSSFDNDGQARFGVTVSWDLNSPSTNLNDIVSTYQNGSGFSLGAVYDIPVIHNLYFEPGLKLFYNTMIIDADIVEDIEMDIEHPLEGSLRNWGFRVPLKFGYRFDFTEDMALSVITGPQLNIGLSLDRYVNMTKKSEGLYGNGWHRLDAQWLFGIRFHYADNWFADIEGGVGMTNMVGGDFYKGVKFRRNTFSIGVGYMF